MPDYIEYNGEKIKPRVFDYDTPEGWSKFVDATYGSITDESFMDTWAKKVDSMYGSITDETFMLPSEWDKNEKVLS